MRFMVRPWQLLLPLFSFLALSLSALVLPAGSGFAAVDRDYVNEIASEGFYTWNENSYPIKIYMRPGSGIPGYSQRDLQILKECFADWTNALGGKLSFELVDSTQEADIVVSWSDQAIETDSGTEAGKTRIFAKYNTQTNWGRIDRAEIRLLTRLPGRAFPEPEVRKAYLHEVGHALGIAGHSSDHNDIMYFAVGSRQSGALSSRDIATINYLYRHGSTTFADPRPAAR
jgi:predicted Zn-dependent protease